MDIEFADTIEVVKAIIQDKDGTPPDHQHLIFNGIDLLNERTLDDCNIRRNDALILSQRPYLLY